MILFLYIPQKQQNRLKTLAYFVFEEVEFLTHKSITMLKPISLNILLNFLCELSNFRPFKDTNQFTKCISLNFYIFFFFSYNLPILPYKSNQNILYFKNFLYLLANFPNSIFSSLYTLFYNILYLFISKIIFYIVI